MSSDGYRAFESFQWISSYNISLDFTRSDSGYLFGIYPGFDIFSQSWIFAYQEIFQFRGRQARIILGFKVFIPAINYLLSDSSRSVVMIDVPLFFMAIYIFPLPVISLLSG